MSLRARNERIALLDSGSQPNTEEENVDGPLDVEMAPGTITELASPEVERSGDYGNHTAQRNVKDTSGMQQMHSVAILMLMLIIVTVTFTQSLSPSMILNGDSSVAQITLIFCMIAGLIVILYLFVFHSKITLEVRQASHNVSTRTQQVNRILSKSLSVVGMSFFFPFACALHLCYIVAATTCDAQWRTLSKLCSAEVFETYLVDVLYHLTRIVFTGAELLFCLQFRKTCFTSHPLPRLGLMLIMAVNIALWFESLIRETEDRVAVDEINLGKVHAFCTVTPVNESYNETIWLQQCLNETSGIQKMCRDATSFLYPFTIEFSLLVGEFLAHKFFSCKDRHNESQHPVVVDEARQEVPTNVENQSGSSRTYLPGAVLIVAIGISANIVFITLAFFAHVAESREDLGEKDSPNPVAFFKVYSVIYYTLMFVFVVLGFVFGWKFEILKKKVRGIDYLVLMSAFGPLMYGQIYVTALARNMSHISENEYGKSPVLIADFVANIAQLSFQAVFVFFADRVRPLTTEQRNDILLRHLYGAFKAIVCVMAVGNLTNWIVDSILLVNISFRQEFLNTIFDQDSWFLVDGILLPLEIFYRFNSFLLFTRAYLNGSA